MSRPMCGNIYKTANNRKKRKHLVKWSRHHYWAWYNDNVKYFK